MNYLSIIHKYYPEDNELRRLLLRHSRQVADRALKIVESHPEWNIDREFLEAAAMLHDIGIVRCDAPGIHCYGTEPYIRHGMMGAEMLRQCSTFNVQCSTFEAFARVCERHTGAGITREEIKRQGLPLPLDRDFMPETLEEQIICYADKFYSKSSPDREKNIEQAANSLRKFGEEGVTRFMEWATRFELNSPTHRS